MTSTPSRSCTATVSTTWSCTRRTATFRFATLERDEPRYVAYHWVDNVAPEAGTTVSFWIEDRAGGVTLRVVESGFSQLRKDRAAIDNQIKENSHGWEVELEAAKRFVLGDPGDAA